MSDDREIKIHILPNLMTAGNLFCGFAAVLLIIQARMQGGIDQVNVTMRIYMDAILFIFGACVFDLLDGRVARISGQESAFGREFDSLADVISFGLAPALLLMDIVLNEFGDTLGQILAFIYLLCGAMRLARFNCAAAQGGGSPKDFYGLPIPMGAGVISSITLAMLYLGDRDVFSKLKFILPILMLTVSALMFSSFRYPSFKNLNWRTKRSVPAVLVAIVIVIFTVRYYEWMPAVVFTAYLLYGLVRPWISRRWRREIEDIDEEGEEEDQAPASPRPKDEGLPSSR